MGLTASTCKADGAFRGESKVKKTKSKPQSEEYSRFEKLAKQILSVPKSEIDKREAQYQRKKAAKKRKAAGMLIARRG